MSPPSLILLSASAPRTFLEAALLHAPAGERLLIVPKQLQKFTGSEPAFNICHEDRALYRQLLDSAIAALRPKSIIADVASLTAVAETIDRHPQLKHAILIADGSENKKLIRALPETYDLQMVKVPH